MKKELLVVLFIYTACLSCNFNFMNGSNPKKESFEYYDTQYRLAAAAVLKTGTKYYYTYPDGNVNVLVFFPDGFLNKYFTTQVTAVTENRVETGVIMGYYKIISDSIFFTTRSYYQKKPTVYAGRVRSDTLDLNVKYPNVNGIKKEVYVLYR